ncbi:MAG: pseudouridine synthase [Anaerolineales bacterium]|nr:pseudouridine synthase [Anaerolineales bacterium]MCB9128504.1 pseudouridine synthase [Ardenticatenales bacterium]
MARYLLFNKPYWVLTSFTDPDAERGERAETRATLGDYIDVPNVYAAGRLDYDSEGLLLLTDDGELAHRLTHPRYKLPKRYWVQVEGMPTEPDFAPIRRGELTIKKRRVAPAEVRLLDPAPAVWPRVPPIRERATIPDTWIELTLREGKKRQVRRMTAATGFPTLRLVRVAIGPLELGELAHGAWRDLSAAELQRLRTALGL